MLGSCGQRGQPSGSAARNGRIAPGYEMEDVSASIGSKEIAEADNSRECHIYQLKHQPNRSETAMEWVQQWTPSSRAKAVTGMVAFQGQCFRAVHASGHHERLAGSAGKSPLSCQAPPSSTLPPASLHGLSLLMRPWLQGRPPKVFPGTKRQTTACNTPHSPDDFLLPSLCSTLMSPTQWLASAPAQLLCY